MTDALISTPSLRIRVPSADDIVAILQIYRECEDFLSLGPVPTASMQMVLDDMDHSQRVKGVFCCILDAAGRHVGVLDFVPESRPRTAYLALLMIARKYRSRGCGTEVVCELESYLKRAYGTELIESGVQVNNPIAVRFWKRCGFTIGTEAEAQDDGTVAYEMYKRTE
jgi:ribosomal protein S18 acetylase RimI-like enzyme